MSNDKIVVITGATGGIGAQICKYLLVHNHIILAACRNTDKGEKMRREIECATMVESKGKLFFIPMDMGSFNSIDNFISCIIEHITTLNKKIDILINNAGIIAPYFELTPDGYESSIQVNYIAVKRLTEALIPHFSPLGGKIINTLSCTIKIGKPTEPYLKKIEQQRKEFISLKNYSNSKLLLALYTIELHKQCNNILVCAIDPGIVNTGIITMHRWYDPIANIFFRPFIKSPVKGAIPIINAIEYNCSSKTPLLFKGKMIRSFSLKHR